MKKLTTKYFAVLLAALMTGVSQVASATVLTFDELSPVYYEAVSNGYGGLSWNNMYVLNTAMIPNSGYANGLVSGSNVAFNASGDLAITFGTGFAFNGAYFTSAWENQNLLTVEGWANGLLVNTKQLMLDTTGPQWLDANFASVDELHFYTAGGMSAGYSGTGKHFAMDNFTFNEAISAVPEADTSAMLIAGLGLIGFISRRKHRSVA